MTVVLLATVGCASAPPSVQADDSRTLQAVPRVRETFPDPRKTIAEQLLPGDQVVHFLQEYESPVTPDRPLSAVDQLRDAVRRAPLVLIMDLKDIDGRLVEGGKHVRTLVSGVVVEVLKGPSGSGVAERAKRSFEIGGGSLKVGDVLVQMYDAVPYEAGQRCVVFLQDRGGTDSEPSSAIVGAYPLVVENGRLKGFPRKSEELTGVGLADVRQAAKRVRD